MLKVVSDVDVFRFEEEEDEFDVEGVEELNGHIVVVSYRGSKDRKRRKLKMMMVNSKLREETQRISRSAPKSDDDDETFKTSILIVYENYSVT